MTLRNVLLRSSSTALAATAAIALTTLATSTAHAQVELRCPQGWSSAPPIAESAEGQRSIVSCRKEPMVVGGVQIAVPVPAGPAEARLAAQLLMQANFAPPESMPTLRDESFGTVRARVYEQSQQGEGPGGTATTVSGVVALIAVGRSTVVLRSISTNGRTPAINGIRQIVPALVGLDGAAPQWRVGLTGCPRPLVRETGQGGTPNGLRLAGACVVESEGKSVEVLESRVAAQSPADARAAADFYRVAMERQFGRRGGGTVTMDEPTPITVQGAQGFYAVVHATVRVQESPTSEPQQLRIDRAVAIAPLDNGGHVELVATVANAPNPAAVRSLIDALIGVVKLDGSQVTGNTAVPGADAPATDGDGGAGAGESDGGASASRPQPREQPRSNFDPNAPMPDWSNIGNERPRASQPAAQKSACGCSTPGADRSGASAFVLAGLAFAGGALGRRRKRA